jgi:hypothetical protein
VRIGKDQKEFETGEWINCQHRTRIHIPTNNLLNIAAGIKALSSKTIQTVTGTETDKKTVSESR